MGVRYGQFLFFTFYLTAFVKAQEIKLEPTMVSGTSSYNGSVVGNESKNIVVITKSDIEKKNYKDLVTVFENSPVTMVTHTQAGPLISLRGSGEKTIMRVKVLLNGTSITSVDDSMGVIPFSAIPVSSIEKIEIIPGGGITLYGSGSSSGVINIITKSGKTAEYGVVNATKSSFDNHNVNLNKGIRLGEKVFANIGLEGEKGNGYREKEKHEKINVLTGVDIQINDKNKIRLSGTKYKENADSTDELDLISLKNNRRGAGPSDAKIKSDKESFGIDYEYRPFEKIVMNFNYDQSKFTRNINQDNRPYLTFLPSDWFNDFFGVPENHQADLVMVDINNQLKGKLEEENKNFRFKTDYKYNRGKLTFGYDYLSSKLHRDMDIRVNPFKPHDSTALFIRKHEDYVINEDILKANPHSLINFNSILTGALIFPGQGENLGLDTDKTLKYASEGFYKYTTDEEEKRNYERTGKVDSFSYDTIRNNIWKVVGDLDREKIINFAQDGRNIIDLQGNKVALTDKDLFKDFLVKINPDYFDPSLKVSTITESQMDVKKDTNSFYIFNNYQLTNKLDIDLGVRYEKADYKGYRHTKATQIIKGNPDKEETKNVIGMYGALSDVEYLKKQGATDWHNTETAKQKLLELKEKGITSITMSEITREERRKEENLGGEIGFNYKFNDTDTVYMKYERGFNTPLPTQLTNKTFDPRTKVKAYWESNVKSEKIDNFEIGFRGTLGNNVTYSVAGFVSDTQNEILSVVKNGSSHMMREWRFVNLDKTRRIGIELQSEQFFEKLRLKESITYIDPRILTNNYEKQLNQIAADKADALYSSYKKTTLDVLLPFHFNFYGNIPDAEGTRLTNEAKVIVNNLMEGKITKEETRNQMKQLLSTTDPQYLPSLKFIINNYIGEPGKPYDPAAKNLERLSKIKENIYTQFENEIIKSANGNYLKKGDRIPLSPKIKMTFSADYQFLEKLNLGSNLTYIGSYLNAEPQNGYEIITSKVPSHFVADIYGTYSVNDDFSIRFGINNVFNHQYYLRQDSRTGTPAPGRTYSIGFNYRF